jgi:hypothetical protein
LDKSNFLRQRKYPGSQSGAIGQAPENAGGFAPFDQHLRWQDSEIGALRGSVADSFAIRLPERGSPTPPRRTMRFGRRLPSAPDGLQVQEQARGVLIQR